MNIGKISFLIGIVLVVIKMFGFGLANISWWIVSAPLYAPIALFLLFMLVGYMVVGARYGSDEIMEKMLEDDEDIDEATKEKIAKLYAKYCK